jgi:DNA-3-methyladenine glycosylase II
MSKSTHIEMPVVVTREFTISPRAPFRLDLTAWALRRRAHNAIDRWDGRPYSRALELNGTPAAIVVRQVNRPERERLTVALTGPGIGQDAETLASKRR